MTGFPDRKTSHPAGMADFPVRKTGFPAKNAHFRSGFVRFSREIQISTPENSPIRGEFLFSGGKTDGFSGMTRFPVRKFGHPRGIGEFLLRNLGHPAGIADFPLWKTRLPGDQVSPDLEVQTARESSPCIDRKSLAP